MDNKQIISEGQISPEENKYQARYEEILHAELTTDNLETYSNNAFNKLSDIIDDAINELDTTNISPNISTAELEDLAMEKLQLPNVGETLEKIANIQDQISFCLKAVANAKANPSSKIFLPTAKNAFSTPRTPGIKVNPPKPPTNNTAATLLLLTQKFDMKPEDIEMAHSKNNPESDDANYNLISIESLHRTILTCDKVGNHTYIFNTNHFTEHNLDNDKITDFTKIELERLLKRHPELGRRIRGSKTFLSNLENAIIDPSGSLELEDKPQTYFGLDETPPDGFLTKNAIAKETGRDISTIYQIVKDAPEIFGIIHHYSMSGQDTIFYSPEQIDYVKQELDKIPDDSYTLIGTFKRQHNNIDTKTIRAFLAKNLNAPGEVINITRGNHKYTYLSPEKVQFLEENLPALQVELPDEDDITIPKFAESLGVDHKSLGKFVLSLGIEPVMRYKKSAGSRPHLTLEQQEAVLANIGTRPPEGTITVAEFANQNNIDVKTVRRAAKRINLEFEKYHWMKREFDYVSPEMHDKLIEAIKNSPKNNGLNKQEN